MVTIRSLVRACGPLGLSLGVMFSLGACAQVGGAVGTGLQTVQSAFGLEDTEEPVRQKPSKYCYRTLGDVTCYAQPLPAREANRLVGYEGPPPRSSSGTGPLIP